MAEHSYIAGTSAADIAASVEQALASGRVTAGTLLPTVRTLAAQLGVATATAAAAYRILQQRGIAVSDGRRGTRIRPLTTVSAPVRVEVPPGVRDLASGNPDARLLPDLGTALRKVRVRQRLYDDPPHDEALVAIARRLFDADGVSDGEIAVVSGALDGIERVLREYARPGDRIAVEDPCFTGVADILASSGLVPQPFAVDDEGPVPAAFARAIGGAVAVVVTPRAQNPTGAAISQRRARELRRLLAARPGVVVIEDDHAGAVAGAPYVTLVGRASHRWAVVRSVSKSLGPDLRVALLAADAQTVARVEGRQTLGIRWVSHVLQRLVAHLLDDSTTARLLERAEETYRQRREALLQELRERGIPARGASGLNVWIPVAEESATAQALMQAGWAVTAGERFRIETPPAIRVTIASLAPRDAAAFANDLAAIIRRRGTAA